ncbi:UDP-N-acetyl-D-galactosamine dehydrogenase [Arcicella sp. BE140]|uniref:nucleotide sugar dehydrogenase n=1 Tax=unclassified Arcicella TaxID=2644986 RepID=UPI002858D743|nr:MULTISPECIES: nucleotide sugar dehydrogenase [unclassified Arcicella]MDR6563299.1 UDP-N-acetyl-D-galactosamine dehydrogenase [Arcicella sp. BE51]MDR6813280.1 UDP-N-acetyl-D-galactosamine dehydrogenase [Arcicella sp. BE140]MDR6824594.1 UDP-N-acetyl-D-galactosamine dehydrogenase [Arcicella sp. BE139]
MRVFEEVVIDNSKVLKLKFILDIQATKIAIIGLGYVGLPLAVEFGKKYHVLGFDINQTRVDELNAGHDRTHEVASAQLKASEKLTFSATPEMLSSCNIFIVTVPTPIDKYKKPDLIPLLSASKTVGKYLKKDDIVIYESTVYPGCTEEDCVPVLEKESGLIFNQDFFCGYSPERINPGDKINTLTKIKKVTSGSNEAIAEFVDKLYGSIIEAGTYKASCIKVAEASKAIENAQRDVNISFVNELSLIFDKMGIDTSEVLEAAGTKWNFLKFKPGLVGGHCIGVDPYYLLHKSESLGYYPQVILSGRRVNDNMGIFVGGKLIKLLIKKGHKIEGSKVLILGITFKENCPDIRNSRVIDVYQELKEFGVKIDVYDPWADKKEVHEEYGITLIDTISEKYDGILLAVSHDEFQQLDLEKLKNPDAVVYDIKSLWNKNLVDARL